MAPINISRRAAFRTLTSGMATGLCAATFVHAATPSSEPNRDAAFDRLQTIWPQLSEKARNGLLAAAEVFAG